MRNTLLLLAVAALTAPAARAAEAPSARTVVSGDYVEARTAEVFTGGCIMNSEGETSGREAILAWRVGEGQVDGVTVDGLAVVAVVAGDRNLGTHELGGADPTRVRAVIRVDARATDAQRAALVTLAKRLAPDLVHDIVDVKAVPIAFTRNGHEYDVEAAEATLHVAMHADHSPTCGAIQWFTPLAATTHAEIGTTREQSWSGRELGTQWSQGDRRSSFFGSFALGS
jgi:hypothetical protein